MGVLATFESEALLLQREDFPAALRALKKIAKDIPDYFHDAAAIVKAKDLRAALAAAELAHEVDEHGDLVRLTYAGDKLPKGADDEWPDRLILGWKKLFRDAKFVCWIEGTPKRVFWADRGVVRARERVEADTRRFENCAAEPRCRPGEGGELSFRYLPRDGGESVVNVQVSAGSGPYEIDFAERAMQPGEEATAVVRVREDGARYPDRNAFSVTGTEGKGTVRGHVWLTIDIPRDEDALHEIVAKDSSERWSGTYLHAKNREKALEDVHRYAARHSTSPGGAFLAEVAKAENIVDALRAAGLEPALEGDHVRGVSFSGDRLVGSERHLLGLLRSFAGLVPRGPFHVRELRVAYAATPGWWIKFVLGHASVDRYYEPRA